MTFVITPSVPGGPGDVDGFVVKTSSTTAIALTSGSITANGKRYSLLADTTHTMTSLLSAFDLHYIYIDDSASTGSTAVIIDSTTEPSLDLARRGRYNGDDRCIGAVTSPSGSATVAYFDVLVVNNHHIRNYIARTSSPQLANNMLPASGVWQTPNLNQSSVVVPVNATEINLQLAGGDVAAFAFSAAASSEWAAVNTSLSDAPNSAAGFDTVNHIFWLPLAASNNIQIGASTDDDALLSAFSNGYGYER